MARPNLGRDPEISSVIDLLAAVGERKLDRRQVLRRGVALGLSVPAITWLMAACGGDDDDDGEPTATSAAATATSGAGATATSGSAEPTPSQFATITAATATPSGQGVSGGRLTLIVSGDVPDLDPQSAYDSTASAVFFGTHEMLVRLKGSDTFSYQPMLAESWESNDDFSEWTFKIPAGVKFHDGTDCDGEAVAKSFRRFHELGLGPVDVIRRFVESPDDITAPDATTVHFKLKTGNELFLAALSSQYGPLVVSPAAMEEHKTADDPYAHEWFRENPVGTGPYMLKEHVRDDHITLVRFPDYHGGWDGAHFDEIVFRIVPESSVRRQLVEAGEADATTENLTPKDVAEIEEAGELNVLRYDSTAVFWTGFNYTKLTAAERQAFSYAFPYEEVREEVWESLIERTSGPCTPTTRGYDPNGFIYDTDLDKAKSMLEEAGFDFSRKLEYWLSSASATDKAIAELFQFNLSEIGVNMEIVQKDEATLTDFFYGEATGEERPEFFSWGWWPDYNDAYNEIYPNFYSASGQTAGANAENAHYYNNARLDELLDLVAPGVPEDEYNKAMYEANNILTELDPGGMYWGSVQWYTVMQKNISGFQPNPIYINTYNVYDMFRTG